MQRIVDALAAAIQRDRAEGVRPLAVVATIGTTSTAAIDPVDEIAEVAQAEGFGARQMERSIRLQPISSGL